MIAVKQGGCAYLGRHTVSLHKYVFLPSLHEYVFLSGLGGAVTATLH